MSVNHELLDDVDWSIDTEIPDSELPETRHGTGTRRRNLRRFLRALMSGVAIPTTVTFSNRLELDYHFDLDNPKRDLARDAGNAARVLGIEGSPVRTQIKSGIDGSPIEVWRWSAPYPGPQATAFVKLPDAPAAVEGERAA